MEDFATFEIAKKLKEKGFNEPCRNAISSYYCTYQDGWCEYLDNRESLDITMDDLHEGDYLLPTIHQTLKWLREEKRIYIVIQPFPSMATHDLVVWSWSFKHNSNGCNIDNTFSDDENYLTYEQAALAGIEYVLDNLI